MLLCARLAPSCCSPTSSSFGPGLRRGRQGRPCSQRAQRDKLPTRFRCRSKPLSLRSAPRTSAEASTRQPPGERRRTKSSIHSTTGRRSATTSVRRARATGGAGYKMVTGMHTDSRYVAEKHCLAAPRLSLGYEWYGETVRAVD